MAEFHRAFKSHLRRPIPSIVSPDDPSLTIARVELGLTLYLHAGLEWAQRGAAAVLKAFLSVVPADMLCWYSTSQMEGWNRVDVDVMTELPRLLSLSWTEGTPRHLFEFVLTDDVECPSCGFRYREIDPERTARAAVLEITLPQELDPGYLLPIARSALVCGPLWSGIGGYVIRLGERFRADAFDVAWSWSRRYSGLDIQDPEATAWLAHSGLPGVNWINIVGDRLAGELAFDVEGARARSWVDPTIAAEVHDGNLLIVAGEAPVIGDKHWFEEPNPYREVGRIAQDLLIAPPRTFLGRFAELGDTGEWFRRFAD